MKSVRHASLIFAAAGIVWAGVACGCAGPAEVSAELGPPSGRSFVRAEEQVTLRLITWTEWKTKYSTKYGINLPELPPMPAAAGNSTERALGIDAAIGAVVGLLVDVVKAEIEKEAARHEQQFTQSVYADDFWAKRGVPRYAAFEVIRTASGFGQDKPAFHMICAILPSRWDRRMVLLKPVYLVDRAAAAKVSPQFNGASRFTIQANTVIQSARMTKDDKIALENVADATFKWPGYNLDNPPALVASYTFGSSDYIDGQPVPNPDNNLPAEGSWQGTLKDVAAGYFLAPLATGTDQGPSGWFDPNKGGAFKLFVSITETDDSRMKDTMLKFAEFVGAQKEKIVKAASKEPPNP